MGRKRLKDLPPNLYEDNGYYRYRNPKTNIKYQLGREREIAIKETLQLNAMLEPTTERVKKILSESDKKHKLFNEFLEYFEAEILPNKKLAPATIIDYKRKLPHIKKAMGNKSFEEIGIFEIAEFLKQFPARQSNNYRSMLTVIFKHAIAEGLTKENPSEATLKKNDEVKRQRLTLEGFYAIREQAPEWLKNTMDLALITAQRRSDLVTLKWADIHGGFIWIQQQKVEKWGAGKIKIPVTQEISATLLKCKGNNEFVISHNKKPVNADYLTKEFAKARNKSKYFEEMENPPSFHEIRALSSFIQKKAGIETAKTQILLGHTSEKMTENYQERHEVIWNEVENEVLQKFYKLLKKEEVNK